MLPYDENSFEMIEAVLQRISDFEPTPFEPPIASDWIGLEAKFGCRFNNTFKIFFSLLGKYRFPGEMLNVSSSQGIGNDTIILSFDLEMEHGQWNKEMIPFYAIGNGDYFCLSCEECPNSRVFYYDHETQVFEIYLESFGKWIQHLPEFFDKA